MQEFERREREFEGRERRKMEGVSANVYKGVRGYWKRKGYERIDGSSGRKKKYRIEVTKLGEDHGGSTSGKKKRFWRFKMKKPKLKLFKKGCYSPKNFFVKLRDAYVKMMLGIANSRAFNVGFGGYAGDMGIGNRPMKEYDEKMLVEIYKSIVMAQQGQLIHPNDSGKLSSEIICKR